MPQVLSEPVRVQSVKCTKCAAPIELRAPHKIQSVACESCGSILDASDPNLAILKEYERKVKYRPLIPLGAKGKIKGEVFQCIGFLRRRVTVDGVNYDWSEYLLYNPFKGFRWLVEYQGHWISSKPAHVTPELVSSWAGQDVYRFLDSEYKHFQTAHASVVFVIGEFYWQIEVGESAVCSDFVCPPYILSREKSKTEVTWSIGEYTTGQDVWAAFQLEAEPPEAVGVAAAQVCPLDEEVVRASSLLLTFALIACAIQILFAIIAQNKLVYRGNFQYSASEQEKSKVSDFFEITGRASNVVVETRADVDNHWLYNTYALIKEEAGADTSVAFSFGREIEYYHGRDSDGAWSEGSKTDDVTVPSVPAGRYYLWVEPQSDQATVNYSVAVTRDQTKLWPLLVVLPLLAIPFLILKCRKWSFEVERWKESDHPLITSGGGESDDDE